MNKSSAFAHSIQHQSIDAKSVQEQYKKTPHTKEGAASISNSPHIAYNNQASHHRSHQNISLVDQQHHGHIQVYENENMEENEFEDTESLKHQVEKTLPKDYRLEVGVRTTDNRQQRTFVAVKKNPKGDAIILRRELREEEVKRMLNIQLIEESNIASVVDDLSDLIADNLNLLE